MTTLTAPASLARPATQPAARASVAAVQAELDHGRRHGALRHLSIPPCPTLLLRLRDAMVGPDPDLQEVAAVAAQDVAMSATLIRRANTPAFGVTEGPPVSTVGQALARLGLKATTAMMTEFLVRAALPVRSPQLERFWERSTRRALAMSFIARKVPGLDVDLAHAHGLFCHVGLPVLLQCMPGYGTTLVEADARIDRTPVATENANHRTDHAVVGALVCKVWQFAPTLAASVRLHHDLPALRERGADGDVQALVAAGLLAEHFMRQAEGLKPDREWRDHAAVALELLGIADSELEDWADALQPLFQAA